MLQGVEVCCRVLLCVCVCCIAGVHVMRLMRFVEFHNRDVCRQRVIIKYYGVATISRINKFSGLFCKRDI